MCPGEEESHTASGESGSHALARLNSPVGLAVDPSGNIFVADYGNHRVRRISKAGIITTVAGNGMTSSPYDPFVEPSPATKAVLAPHDVAIGKWNKRVADSSRVAQQLETSLATDFTAVGIANETNRLLKHVMISGTLEDSSTPANRTPEGEHWPAQKHDDGHAERDRKNNQHHLERVRGVARG
jgi:NHL repeat